MVNSAESTEQKTKSRADYARQYYWDHHDTITAQQRARYVKKSERERERYRKYYTAHRAQILAGRKEKGIMGQKSL